MHDVAKGFRLCWEWEKLPSWIKAGFLNLKGLVALSEWFFEGGEKDVDDSSCVGFQRVFIHRRQFWLAWELPSHYVLGLRKAKTEDGREGEELGNITSWSKIWVESVTVTMQIALVTDQALSQACPLLHIGKTGLSELRWDELVIVLTG